MTRAPTISLLLLCPLLAACGGRSLPLSGDGAPLPGDATRPPAADGGVVGSDLGPPSQGVCTIAIRVDTCCTQPQPTLTAQVSQDPCLVPWPAKTIPKQCLDKWPDYCDPVNCAKGMPPSRVVEVVPGGGCVWADECHDKSDCTLARDARGCCSCLEPWPRSLVGLDKCLVGPQSTAPAGCAEDCHQVLCEACPPPPEYECLENAPAKLWTCRVVYTK